MALPKSEFLQTLPPTFAALPFDPRIRVGLQLSIAPSDDYHGILINSIEGTEKALNRLTSIYDMVGLEPSIAIDLSLKQKKDAYEYEANDFPPHLKDIPWSDQSYITSIFNWEALAETLKLLLYDSIPEELKQLAPENIRTIQDLVDRNRSLHTKTHNMFTEGNIGDRDDWYTDAVFAQQRLTGNNPTTIKLATQEWVDKFAGAAKLQHNDAVAQRISDTSAGKLYTQDYSWYRHDLGVGPDANLVSDDGNRYGSASVCLFQLSPQGQLHPLAIILDFKGSMDASVTVFNRRLTPSDTTVDQFADWPWRYAKTVMQASDWLHHEAIAHLTLTHFVEETFIVAAHRSLPSDHVILKTLEKTWVKTLSLNALARSSLVPYVVAPIVGFSTASLYTFVRNQHAAFDWINAQVPNDLNSRGFPVDKLDDLEYHNCGYARCIYAVWQTLRTFISTVLSDAYGSDNDVLNDGGLTKLCEQMRSEGGGNMQTFPARFTTLEQLIDTVTLAIHIASPQHTAVNYLQQYYQVFVPNKPSAMFSPIPTSLQQYEQITQQDLLDALPIKQTKDWLLMTQLPYLLSFRVSGSESIKHYANWAYWRRPWSGKGSGLSRGGKVLKNDLDDLEKVLEGYSNDLDDQTKPYDVLYPDYTAQSILI